MAARPRCLGWPAKMSSIFVRTIAPFAGALALGSMTAAHPAFGAESIGALTPGTVIWWTGGGAKTYRVDGYTLRISARDIAAPGPAIEPFLHLTAPTGEEYEISGEPSFIRYASLGMGKLDPANPGDQVIFATYSGGAHCCTRIDILELTGGKWENIALRNGKNIFGDADGEPLSQFPVDVDGNGAPDTVLRDDSFLYQFDAYALSWAPPRIFEIRNDAINEVTTEPRYAHVFEADMEGSRASCLRHSNGGCAGFVADAARSGHFGEAWAVMLSSHDPKSDWGLTRCDTKYSSAGRCPAGHEVHFPDFPSALRAFLAGRGYISGR